MHKSTILGKSDSISQVMVWDFFLFKWLPFNCFSNLNMLLLSCDILV